MIEAAWNTYVKVPLPWVRTLGPEYWASQARGTGHAPSKYRRLQADSYPFLNAITDGLPRSTTILDVGCNTGRHLQALNRRGYHAVTGIDILPSENPAILHGTFQQILPTLGDHSFDVVCTFGMTIELISPSFSICHHMARVATRRVVLVVQEVNVPYPRLYRKEFAREGFTMTFYLNPVTLGSAASLFVFERNP